MECTSFEAKLCCGCNIKDMYKGEGPWSFNVGCVVPSRYHCVLYELPVNLKYPPKPHCSKQLRTWDLHHVRMPFSDENLFPIKENGADIIKKRWQVIKEALSNSILSSYEFEIALNKYNINLPKFQLLHHFFNEVVSPEESQHFFSNCLPKIIKLALRLPELIPDGIPLLQQNHNRSLSLSQLQISSLLSNAFLCTFPWKKSVASSYPGVNFTTLYSSFERPNRNQSMFGKLKCLINYFDRVTQQEPLGVVTFERKFIPRNKMPKWDVEDKALGDIKVHISSTGTIEDALGFLQVDFANKNIGGGVLRYGCVQEEIRFIICPELIVSRLFTEQLAQGEAVVITGVERFNNYTGYGDTFEYAGNHVDATPHDLFGRRRTSLCVIDAVMFDKPQYQFQSTMILRELNKAFVGFSSREKEKLPPVATGNWGCGAFNGSKMLKCLIQLMACAVAGRNLVYYSFGDKELVQKFYDMYLFLTKNLVTVKQLWSALRQLSRSPIEEQRLYLLIKHTYFEQRRQPSISRFFSRNNTLPRSKTENDNIAPTSSNNAESTESPSSFQEKHSTLTKLNGGISPSLSSSSSSDDVIPSSPQEPRKFIKLNNIKKPKKSTDEIKDKLPDIDISAILEEVDGNANRPLSTPKHKESVSTSEDVIISMEVDDVEIESNFKPQRKKITDYFSKSNK